MIIEYFLLLQKKWKICWLKFAIIVFKKYIGKELMKMIEIVNNDVFDNAEAYFEYFDKKCVELGKYERNYKVVEEIKKICGEMLEVINAITPDTFFNSVSKILGYDARLQILIEMANEFPMLSSEQVIELSRKEYKSYSKELCGYFLKDVVPHSLYFSVN